jgi:ABC-type transporter Mla MlaB component
MKTTKRKRETTTAVKAKAPARAKAAPDRPVAPAAAPIVEIAPLAEPVASVAAVAPSLAVSSTAGNVIALAGMCTVREATALKQALMQWMEKDEVVIDAGNLERIDTAAVQLLCAFVRDRAAASRKVTWAGASAALRDAARLLGVSDMLALAPGASA